LFGKDEAAHVANAKLAAEVGSRKLNAPLKLLLKGFEELVDG
jgi:hypothetical protein